jgi:heme/copper-type cytochrome/quinol oxidase subunit 3
LERQRRAYQYLCWSGEYRCAPDLKSVCGAGASRRRTPQTKQAFWYLWLTIGGGLTFLVIKGFEWGGEIAHGYTLTTNLFWSFYYMATGLHTFHVMAGLLIMAIVSLEVRRASNLHHVELIGIYWHFVDVVWIFLFPLLYIAK